MKPTPFNPETDLPPIPFEDRHCELAASLKEAGLEWTPHVGCFVWDRDTHIPVPSPFPRNIYFILNLGHFLKLLGGIEAVRKKLIWLPTWQQGRILCSRLGISGEEVLETLRAHGAAAVGEDLFAVYTKILQALRAGRK